MNDDSTQLNLLDLPHGDSWDWYLDQEETKPKVSDGCLHDWKLYRGLNFDDYYCVKCGITKPIDK